MRKAFLCLLALTCLLVPSAQAGILSGGETAPEVVDFTALTGIEPAGVEEQVGTGTLYGYEAVDDDAFAILDEALEAAGFTLTQQFELPAGDMGDDLASLGTAICYQVSNGVYDLTIVRLPQAQYLAVLYPQGKAPDRPVPATATPRPTQAKAPRECLLCHGTKICQACKAWGDGYHITCQLCLGSHLCHRCGGTGWEE